MEEALALLDITGVTGSASLRHLVRPGAAAGPVGTGVPRAAAQPRLSADLSLRVFCSARDGDWRRAALILQTAQTLGDIRGAGPTC